MGRKPSKDEQREFLEYLRSGRDEMNLLEHSISSANKQVDRDTRSLEFSRDASDPETGEPIKRTWKVTFSGEYGRPTPKDDDVFVALMKVSQAQGLMDASNNAVTPQVLFSSYELIRILGWGDDGRSYKAIDDALNRLCGVRIVAKNYFYDNKAKLWVDRKFGIIDDVYLYERAKYDRARRKAIDEGEPNPQSWLRWSDVMLESFQAGYVRKLDIEFYRSLNNPIARKLFRYLGKQFWQGRTKHEIEIAELCVEKLGYKSGTAVRELRRRIKPAIEELEGSGAFGLKHKYESSYGKCRVIFKKTHQERKKSEATGLLAKLIELRVRRDDAERAVKMHRPERIIEDIEDSGFREKHGQLRGTRAGCLASMLKSEEPWDRPQAFVSSIEKKKQAKIAEVRRVAKKKADLEEQERRQQEFAAKQAAFERFYNSLPTDSDREAFGEEALANATFYRSRYKDCLKNKDEDKAEGYRVMAMQQLFEERKSTYKDETELH